MGEIAGMRAVRPRHVADRQCNAGLPGGLNVLYTARIKAHCSMRGLISFRRSKNKNCIRFYRYFTFGNLIAYMKLLINRFAFLLFPLAGCFGQAKYFQPSGIIDKTTELTSKNSWVSLENKVSIDGYMRIGDSIFGGEIACNIKPLENIDAKTFCVWPGSKYAKDKNHVYYPRQITCADGTDCGVCYYAETIVDSASPATFKYLGKDYATDGISVYFRGELLPGADGHTLKVIEGPKYFYFATDKYHVYKHDAIFPYADPATFSYKKTDPRNKVSDFENRYIIGDKDSLWEYTPPDQIKALH